MNASVMSNLVSYVLAAAAKQACDGAVETILTNLKPTLLSLTGDDRAALPRIGAKNDAMTAKALMYAQANSYLVPEFLSLDEYQRDVDCVAILTPYLQVFVQLVEMMQDTIAQARAEGYTAGLAVYQMSKTAEKMNVPGAGTIAADLGTCFARSGRRTTVTTPPPAPSGPPSAQD